MEILTIERKKERIFFLKKTLFVKKKNVYDWQDTEKWKFCNILSSCRRLHLGLVLHDVLKCDSYNIFKNELGGVWCF